MTQPARTAVQWAAIWCIPLALAAIAAIAHPKRPQWTRPQATGEVSVEEAMRMSGVLWVDARSEAEHQKAHIPGALPLNEDHWERLLPAILSAWQPEDAVVVYCDSSRCDASRQVARRLEREAGIEQVKILKGGWQAWQDRPQSAK